MMSGKFKGPSSWNVGRPAIIAVATLIVVVVVFVSTRSAHTDTATTPPGRLRPTFLPLPVLATREEMLSAICGREVIRAAAEVGVKQGYFGDQILTRCTGVTNYVGVDLWGHQPFYDDGANVADAEQEQFYADTKNVLEKHKGRWRLLRQDSERAAASFPDGHFDFVYLDARHDYRSVQDDIRAWAPKVRPGGILAGHDYIDATEARGWNKYKDGTISHETKAVRSAITEYAEQTGRQLVATYGDLWECQPFPSWFVRI